jgi:hypothetical protein
MRAKTILTRKQRIVTGLAMLAVVAFFSILGAAHKGSTGGDPCQPGANTPQVCEVQRAIDRQHEAENSAAEVGQP